MSRRCRKDRASSGVFARRPASPPCSRDIRARLPSAEAFYDWGGGLVWLSLDAAEAGPEGGAASCAKS